VEPFQFGFMVRAFAGVSLIAVLSGIVGTFIMLRGLAFIGDAVAHASFGGIVLAMLVGIPLHIGALVFGFGTALLVAALERKTKLQADTSLAILFTGAFSIGVLGLATRPGFAGDLSSLLVGSVLSIRPADLWWIVAAVIVAGLVMMVLFRRLVYISFDASGAEAAGLPVGWLHTLLLGLVALSVVVSLQAVGAILVVALLITPAATASLFTKRMERLIAGAIGIGLVATWAGLYASYYLATPPGATIVALLTLQFGCALIVQKTRERVTKKGAVHAA
jgi:ABC-type Mn2+/Zn2+ transport system permease subunit